MRKQQEAAESLLQLDLAFYESRRNVGGESKGVVGRPALVM